MTNNKILKTYAFLSIDIRKRFTIPGINIVSMPMGLMADFNNMVNL